MPRARTAALQAEQIAHALRQARRLARKANGLLPGSVTLRRPRTVEGARAELLRVKGVLLDIEDRLARGALVPADQVRREVFTTARTLRDRVLNIPSRTAAELATMTEPEAVRRCLEAAVLEAFDFPPLDAWMRGPV